MSGYSDAELQAIETWLRDGLSGGQIATLFSREHRPVTRNAIIGIVHRNKVLGAIGFADPAPPPKGVRQAPRVPAPAKAMAPKPSSTRGKLSPVRIVGKKESRALDPVFRPPQPGAPDHGKGRPPHAYDAASRHLPLEALGSRDCRFAVNDAAEGKTHLFCGMPAAPDSPYCAHHSGRAFNGLAAAQRKTGRPFSASFVPLPVARAGQRGR